MSDTAGKSYIDLTANIVSAYLSNNPTQASEIPNLISQVHAALLRVTTGRAAEVASRSGSGRSLRRHPLTPGQALPASSQTSPTSMSSSRPSGSFTPRE